MPVYVHSMKAKYRRMIMCHMIADTDEELHKMADMIGVDRKWHQCAGTYKSHYDICMSKRNLAIKADATEISQSELGKLLKRKRLTNNSDSV